ncbi:uncharacterized protein TRIVIDRAFT_177774, partial [Trichoderma virens Gv29-8]
EALTFFGSPLASHCRFDVFCPRSPSSSLSSSFFLLPPHSLLSIFFFPNSCGLSSSIPVLSTFLFLLRFRARFRPRKTPRRYVLAVCDFPLRCCK